MSNARSVKPLQFRSFIQGGFECAYPLTVSGQRLDLLRDTKHEEYCVEDYRLLKSIGMRTVREGLAWHQIDRGNGKYDFSRFELLLQAGQAEEMQQIWDLNHFDYPGDLDAFSGAFVDRFARYAVEAIKFLRHYIFDELSIVPWNEISFTALIAADWGEWAPFANSRGYEFKKQLVRATLAAQVAIWELDPTVRFIHVDPIFYRRARLGSSPAALAAARAFREIKMQAWDMITGRLEPELGGAPRFLDILGCNYYYYNQEFITEADGELSYKTIGWNSHYRVSLETMLAEVYRRYRRPLVITETGGWGELRRIWWRRTLRELDDAIAHGVPVYGVCAYPIIDRPDWTDGHLTNSGLWDFAADDPLRRRVPHPISIELVQRFGAAHVVGDNGKRSKW